MIKRQVFFSFHYKNDVRRAAQIRSIGQLEGEKPVSDNEWEEVSNKTDKEIENWIDSNMQYRSCLVVLIGSETYSRKWVKYEIKHAWEKGMGVLGIYIHNIKDPINGTCEKGKNPFDEFNFGNVKFSSVVKCYNPDPYDAYNDVKNNISRWVEEAINIRNKY